jgi:hypothetical protein
MRISNLLRSIALQISLLGAFVLIGCGGGGGNVPGPVVVPPIVNVNPPNVGPSVAPTISFDSPSENLYFTGPMDFQFTVTGSPDKVELYKNGVLEATLQAPYAYRWENPSEPEDAYTFTAIAIKAGTADVISAQRTITIDRTFPELVSRTPADGARNVLVTDEISLTFSEPMMAGSIDANSVRLYIGQTELVSTTRLDSTGKKINVAFARSPILPATVTLVVNGVKDLSGKGAIVPNVSFGVVSQAITGSPTVVLSLARSIATTSGGTEAKINLQNFSGSTPLRSTVSILLVSGDRYLATNPSTVAQGPAVCPVGYCYLTTIDAKSYHNGSYQLKVQVFLADGTVIESNEVPFTVAIENLADSFPLNWSTEVGSIGSVRGATIPQVYVDAQTPRNGRLIAGFPVDTKWWSHQQVFDSVSNAEAGVAVITRQFPIQGAYNRIGRAFGYAFSLYYDNQAFNGDTLTARARSCNGPTDCTVWNGRATTIKFDPNPSGQLFLTAPLKDVSSYIEVELTFDSNRRNSTFLINRVDFSLY